MKNKGNLVFGLLAGAAVGAAIGMMFRPIKARSFAKKAKASPMMYSKPSKHGSGSLVIHFPRRSKRSKAI
jgi:gas vesicle protein